MNGIYLLVVCLCLTGLLIRDVYELLKQAGKIDTKNKAIFVMLVIAMSVMLLSWPVMCPLDPWRIAVPAAARWTGIGMLAISAVLMLGALLQLRGVENIDHLVTSGLFSRLRHPMYTGFILWIAGWIVLFGAAASLIAGLAAIGSILWWRHLEECALVAAYGEDYRRYRQRTWF
jgi:protein-S-isoprenylcysteine O-methyltransferase Ste14